MKIQTNCEIFCVYRYFDDRKKRFESQKQPTTNDTSLVKSTPIYADSSNEQIPPLLPVGTVQISMFQTDSPMNTKQLPSNLQNLFLTMNMLYGVVIPLLDVDRNNQLGLVNMDPNFDSVNVSQSMVECLLFNMNLDPKIIRHKRQLLKFLPDDMISILSTPLKLYFYGENTSRSLRTKEWYTQGKSLKSDDTLEFQKTFQELGDADNVSVDALKTWRHSIECKDLRENQNNPKVVEENKKRMKCLEFYRLLFRDFFTMSFRSRLDTNFVPPDYFNLIDLTLNRYQISSMPPLVLESRIKSLAYSMLIPTQQRPLGLFFNTFKYAKTADELQSVMDPLIYEIIVKFQTIGLSLLHSDVRKIIQEQELKKAQQQQQQHQQQNQASKQAMNTIQSGHYSFSYPATTGQNQNVHVNLDQGIWSRSDQSDWKSTRPETRDPFIRIPVASVSTASAVESPWIQGNQMPGVETSGMSTNPLIQSGPLIHTSIPVILNPIPSQSTEIISPVLPLNPPSNGNGGNFENTSSAQGKKIIAAPVFGDSFAPR